MAGKKRSRPPRWRSLAIILGVATAGAVLLWIAFSDNLPADRDTKGTIYTIPVTTPSAAGPDSQRSALAGAARAAIPPSAGMKHALALPYGAVVRDVQSYSRKYGISCGEVSRDGSPENFRRFFYIAEMKTGGIDDGTEEFRVHAAYVCTAREL